MMADTDALRATVQARAHLPTLRRVTSGDVFGENVGVPLPLVRQLVRGVLNPQAEPIPDLVQVCVQHGFTWH